MFERLFILSFVSALIAMIWAYRENYILFRCARLNKPKCFDKQGQKQLRRTVISSLLFFFLTSLSIALIQLGEMEVENIEISFNQIFLSFGLTLIGTTLGGLLGVIVIGFRVWLNMRLYDIDANNNRQM